MEKIVERIKIKNYKRFQEFELSFNEKINLIVGDNESGKSTILSAIDLICSASENKIKSIGLDKLFNVDTINEFLAGEKDYEDLPILEIELFLNDHDNQNIDGQNNSDGIIAHGLKLKCSPNENLRDETITILEQEEDNFPFEFYKIQFKTFQGRDYYSQNNYLSHLIIDSTQINYSYANKKYVIDNYLSWLEDSEEIMHRNEYRRNKVKFSQDILNELNQRIGDNYSFIAKTDTNSNLHSDLTIIEEGVSIENKGKGRQCFIKTDFALQQRRRPLDILLIEEPENHLSQLNMKRLIQKISNAENTQLIIATHSDLICSRLDLRNAILLSSISQEKLLLNDLSIDTANFFIKSPTNNILEFILSEKVILVEGDAEYILMEHFYQLITGKKPEEDNVHIISVGGTSFPRYLEVAKLLGIQTAVITDNDGNFETNCVTRFEAYNEDEFIEIFYEPDNQIETFEIAIYQANTESCDELFLPGRRTLTVQEYMLSNKTESSYQLLTKKPEVLNPPDYIRRGIQWISQ